MPSPTAPHATSADDELLSILPVSHAKQAKAPPKSRVVSFRLADKAHDLLMDKANESGLSPRAWLERAILENQTQIVSRQKPHPELRPTLFLYGKASNNLNQLAHHFNSQFLMGKITAETVEGAIEVLSSIRALLLDRVHGARSD